MSTNASFPSHIIAHSATLEALLSHARLVAQKMSTGSDFRVASAVSERTPSGSCSLV